MNASISSEEHPEESPSRLALIMDGLCRTIFLGYVSGLLIAFAAFAHVWHDHYIEWNIHLAWMPLVSTAILLLTLLILISPCALLLPRKSFDFIASGFIGFFAAFSVLASLHVFSIWAIAFLSLGIGVQLGRKFQKHPSALRRCSRIAVPILTVIIVGLAVGIVSWRTSQEQRLLSTLPENDTNGSNILFVVWDTVRADQVGTFRATGAETPHLSELANRGVIFDSAIASASWTLPSHASMFTGQFPNQLSADWYAPVEPETTMLAEILRDHGYHTAGFVANTRYCGRGVGMDQGFLHFEDFKIDYRPIAQTNFFYRLLSSKWRPHTEKFKTRHEINKHFIQWHEQRTSQRPFFAFLNYMDAHTPYLPDRIDGRPLTESELARMQSFEQRDPDDISEEDRKLAQKCYRAEISSLDASLGKLIEYLKQQEIFEKTTVIVVSDHGEHFGEHGLYYHGNSLYQAVVHVPLVISPPESQVAASRVNESVSLRNIAATILDCAGVTKETSIQGYSLLALAEGRLEFKDNDIVYAYNSLKGIEEHDSSVLPFFLDSRAWKGRIDLWEQEEFFLLDGPESHLELYNIPNDPEEMNDLSENEQESDRLNKMKRQLHRFLDESSKDLNQNTPLSDSP